MAEVSSPCTGVCRIDRVSGHCLGCRRTMDEIVDWPMLPPRGKRAILARIEGRAVPRAK